MDIRALAVISHHVSLTLMCGNIFEKEQSLPAGGN
jgi:hypothetical protein